MFLKMCVGKNLNKFLRAANSNQSLKQTGRTNAAIEHFYFAGLFRGSKVSQSAPSGSLALRYNLEEI